MNPLRHDSRLIAVPRWIARIWGMLAFLAVVLVALGPDGQAAGQSVPLIEWLLLSLYPLAALGLILAWRWELLGGTLAVACMLLEIVGFRLVKGGYPDLFGYAVPLVLFALPGILFVICWVLSRRSPAPAGP